jgi:hypothetical protein
MGCVWVGLMRNGFGLIFLVKHMTKCFLELKDTTYMISA